LLLFATPGHEVCTILPTENFSSHFRRFLGGGMRSAKFFSICNSCTSSCLLPPAPRPAYRPAATHVYLTLQIRAGCVDPIYVLQKGAILLKGQRPGQSGKHLKFPYPGRRNSSGPLALFSICLTSIKNCKSLFYRQSHQKATS